MVQKETIQPTVVHTTIPVHESHHNKDIHHETTSLPAMTMSEFQSKGGVLNGREERHDGFEGEPKKIGSSVISGHHHYDRSGHSTELTGGHSAGPTDRHFQSNTGLNQSSSHTSNNSKPGLMEKINPKVDADRDGKVGFMD